jgi:hypothetical protein
MSSDEHVRDHRDGRVTRAASSTDRLTRTGVPINQRTYKAIASTLAAACLALTLAAGADAHRGAPYRTNAWAERMLKRVHYWRGYAVTSDFGCWGDFVDSKTNRNGEDIYKHFDCNLNTRDYSHSFKVTLHTIRYSPYFRLTAGWR